MDKHYRTLSSVMLLLLREVEGNRQILLQKRQNTGFADGKWECGATGHVEAGESMRLALAREAKEELGCASGGEERKRWNITR